MTKLTLSLLLLVAALIADPAQAAVNCMSNDNKCDPDKLCTFKAEYQSKLFIYVTYLRNSPTGRRNGSVEGVRYNGRLYNESVAEARRDFPNDSKDEQMIKAAAIFQEKIRKYVTENFKMPKCRFNGNVNPAFVPKAGYSGMETTEHCQVWVKFEGGQFDPNGFGARHTSCQEFYDRDLAHEQIHKKACEAAKADNTQLKREKIDGAIEEEIVAYRHSVRLTDAYMRLLSLRCSSKERPAENQKRMKRIQDLLAPYQAKTGVSR